MTTVRTGVDADAVSALLQRARDTRETRVASMARWRLNWEPGTGCEYHPTSDHWVLAEVIDRVTGIDHRDFVEQRVTTPAGLPRVLGVTDQSDIAELELRGEPATPDELEVVLGVRETAVGEARRSDTTGRQVRSPGSTPPRACPSGSSRTASTPT